MKNLFTILIVGLFLFGMAFTSCKKDSSSSTPQDTLNYFKYEGKKYEVVNAFAVYNSDFSGSGLYIYRVYMVPKTVIYDSWLQSVEGNGNGLVFDVVTNSATSFYKSSFAVDTLDNNVELGEICNPFMGFNYDFFMEDGATVSLKSGSCTMNQVGTNYEFIANFKTTDNKPVEAYYKGVVVKGK